MQQDIRQEMRKQVISSFAGITIDMNYRLCVPSVHATFEGEELIVDYGGNIHNSTSAFPQDKAELVKRWVSLHKDEIQRNHHIIGSGVGPLIAIPPLEDCLCIK